jgi:DNA-binding phage protein
MENIDAVRQRFTLLEGGVLDERTRRLVAAAEALTLGWGGVSLAARATGFSRRTIQRGMQELQQPSQVSAGRVRKPGGGRKTTVSQDATLLRDL